MSTNEKRINSRVILKHELEVNWLKATTFVPYKGEFIIYDVEVDENGNHITQTVDGVEKTVHELAGRTTPYTYERLKIGDGINTVSDLPFIDTALRDEITETYATKNEVAAINTQAIIDVVDFPTEDIKEDSFYRVTKGTFYIGNSINSLMVCHMIDELPETGLPTFDYSGNYNTEEHLYYRASDDTLWTYMSEEFLQYQQGNPYIEGCEVGWHRAEPFFAKCDQVYNGTFTDVSAVPSTGYSLVLEQKDLYLYENGWNKLKLIQTGSDDTAEIFNTLANEAVGSYTHAEGYGTYAIGGGSHAEGYGTHAGTTSSIAAAHAEGYETNASSQFSHAEGYTTTAYYAAHAEGYYTKATGSYSHAEGNSTTASENSSHAEGNNTTASGVASHSEGFYATASGKYAHSEGQQTDALGQSTHAEGALTTAFGMYSHAEGYCTNTFGEASHAEGSSTTTCFSAGVDSSTSNDDILAKRKSKAFSLAKGANSHVEGKDNLALGTQAHAEGEGTTASGSNSHAEGSFTKASGDAAHAEGLGSRATSAQAHAEGEYTTASGMFSHAEGDRTAAAGMGSHAEGLCTVAVSDYQHVQGRHNLPDVNNTYAHIVGNGSSDGTMVSNAHTLDWEGNAWFAGDVYVGSTSGTDKDDGSKKLATENFVDTNFIAKIAESQTITGNLAIAGKLQVQGTTETVDAVTYKIENNVIEFNPNKIHNETWLTGLAINKGLDGETDLGTYGIMYDPSTDAVKLGFGHVDEENKFKFNIDESAPIATRDEFDDSWEDDAIFVFDKATKKFKYSGKTLSGFKKEIQDEMKDYVAKYIETYMSTEIEIDEDGNTYTSLNLTGTEEYTTNSDGSQTLKIITGGNS